MSIHMHEDGVSSLSAGMFWLLVFIATILAI